MCEVISYVQVPTLNESPRQVVFWNIISRCVTVLSMADCRFVAYASCALREGSVVKELLEIESNVH